MRPSHDGLNGTAEIQLRQVFSVRAGTEAAAVLVREAVVRLTGNSGPTSQVRRPEAGGAKRAMERRSGLTRAWAGRDTLGGTAMAMVKVTCFAALVLVVALRAAAALADGPGTPFMIGADARGGPVQPLVAQGGPAPGATLCVRGRLTGEGVECQALRAKDGALYTLAGGLNDFQVGDEVCVCGTIAAVSICMQGATIAVARVGPAGECP